MDEESAEVRKFRKELNAGAVSLVLLALLEGATAPMYGYQIGRRLEERVAGDPPVKQGTLYPLLRTMESNGLLASEVEPSVAGPPRRYYTITDRGRQLLPLWRRAWQETRDFVDSVVFREVRAAGDPWATPSPETTAGPGPARGGNDRG